ncbi:retrovirus-related pol polyprotein from transposon TNT 1-94 [Tanacetum coccineum]
MGYLVRAYYGISPTRQSHNLPPSPPSPLPNKTPPTSPITTNSLSSPSLPHNPTQNQIAHKLHHLSNLLEINLQQAIKATNPSPPTSPSEYGVSTSIGYSVSNLLSNTAYSIQLINTAYPLPLDTTYRSSVTEEKPKRHFKTLILDELRSPNFNLLSDQEYSEEEVTETMAETMEQYMSKTRADYGSGVARPKIEDTDNFELKGQFLKELRTNTFSGSDHEDANEHIEKVLEIVDLFHIPNITIDQVMLRAFPMSLIGAVSRWLRNKPTSWITTWEDLKTKFLSKYCPPTRTTKKMEEINDFQQEPDKNLYHAWE